jgi:hypothetical protein
MSLPLIISIIFAGVCFVEILSQILVIYLRKDCPWLITSKDHVPDIDQDDLNRFVKHGWDSELGWNRKPLTERDEYSSTGNKTTFHIDQLGARKNPGFENQAPEILACGDSYTFARFVNDDETWPNQLSHNLKTNVANFGVGNYGLDQATLRLEREIKQHPTSIVLMGVVPETISRVHSYWKHYSEYGNILAFKPRFILKNEDLELLENPISTVDMFNQLELILPAVQNNDYFYETKFLKDVIKFPYSLNILKNSSRHVPLILAALKDRFKGNTQSSYAFEKVIDRNIDIAATLYKNEECLDLLSLVCKRFKSTVEQFNATPIFIMLPQIQDINRISSGDHYYLPLINKLETANLLTIDFGPLLSAVKDPSKLFVEDKYGGHYSVEGNQIVADHISKELSDLQTFADKFPDSVSLKG